MEQGERFKSFRLKANLSQKEAANKIGVKPYQLANYETGRSEPSISVLKNMSMVYKASIDKLVGNNLVIDKSINAQTIFDEEKAAITKRLEDILETFKEWDIDDPKAYPGQE